VIRLAIIDSGGANIASLRYALDRLGIESQVTTDAATLRDATHVILPGVVPCNRLLRRHRAGSRAWRPARAPRRS